MNLTIEVTRERADRLSTEVWRFVLIDFHLVLDSYARGTRPSTRHKFSFPPGYNRLNTRDYRLPETDVPWPLDVEEEAREKLLTEITSKLRVGRWIADFKKT